MSGAISRSATVPRCKHCHSDAHDSDQCMWPSFANASEAAGPLVAKLAPREREVLRWIASDLSEQHIAQVMGLSVHTVHDYRKRLYKQLGVGTAVGATIVAFRAGVVS